MFPSPGSLHCRPHCSIRHAATSTFYILTYIETHIRIFERPVLISISLYIWTCEQVVCWQCWCPACRRGWSTWPATAAATARRSAARAWSAPRSRPRTGSRATPSRPPGLCAAGGCPPGCCWACPGWGPPPTFSPSASSCRGPALSGPGLGWRPTSARWTLPGHFSSSHSVAPSCSARHAQPRTVLFGSAGGSELATPLDAVAVLFPPSSSRSELRNVVHFY